MLLLTSTMRKKIISQTKYRVKQLLDKKQPQKNLEKLKRARYMRGEYSQQKKRLNLTFDIPDFLKIQKEADNTGLTPTAFLRATALAYLGNSRLPSPSTEQKFSELVFLFRNISNNLNQIARQANTVQKLSLSGFINTKATINNLEDTAEAFMKRL